MSRPTSKIRAMAEITIVAGALFVIPFAYLYGRDNIINFQNRVYNKMFGIREDDYKRVIEEKQRRI